MEQRNFILDTDSYKISHHVQYPPKTENIYSYFESRGGSFDKIVFFGLQYILMEHFIGHRVRTTDIDEAEEFFQLHFGREIFNRSGWERLLQKHDGFLPLRIRALPEGTIAKPLDVLVTVENTDPEFYWLTNYAETLLSQLWYPCTVASNSYAMAEIIREFLRRTGDESQLPFKLHDFGFRGVSCAEQAGIGGCAHLVNFMGTDTLAALVIANDYYFEKMAGFSIPASEHSTITAWGRGREKEAYQNMLDKYPTGLVACVSDSYDIYHACDIWGSMKDQILSRDGTLVIRPDSGDPPIVIERCLNILEGHFGSIVNEKGYRELPPQLRLIQGDGIDRHMVRTILQHMEKNGWSANNIAFGSGGGLLQKLDRDTCKFAFKCSSAIIDGKEVNVSKSPLGDTWKKSKAGRFNNENLELVFENGRITRHQTLSNIRERVQNGSN